MKEQIESFPAKLRCDTIGILYKTFNRLELVELSSIYLYIYMYTYKDLYFKSTTTIHTNINAVGYTMKFN